MAVAGPLFAEPIEPADGDYSMQDRDWFLPSLGLTVLTTGIALWFIPRFDGLLPALRILPAWMASAALIAAFAGMIWMMRRGVKQPITEMRAFVRANPGKIASMTAFILLAGMNLIAFMWMKPLLNYLVPFTADPALAQIDNALFLGHDPWTLVSWMSFPAAGIIYHPAWFVMMILALLMTAAKPPSAERSAVLLGYFVLWSLVGPAIHTLVPAAGPIFYERMGYGPRFAALDGGPETRAVADYLWTIYSTGSFGAGSGISAMPSMHVTISSWTVIAFNFFAPRWRGVAIFAWAVIFLMSIALGWHYACDGIVGAIAALACHFTLLRLFRTAPNFASALMPTRLGAMPQPSVSRAAE